jgi:hypothetical protein
MSDKIAEIQQRHAHGYKGIAAERVFPDVAALLIEVDRLRAALETIVECFAEQGTQGHHECLRIAREALASDKPRYD